MMIEEEQKRTIRQANIHSLLHLYCTTYSLALMQTIHIPYAHTSTCTEANTSPEQSLRNQHLICILILFQVTAFNTLSLTLALLLHHLAHALKATSATRTF